MVPTPRNAVPQQPFSFFCITSLIAWSQGPSHVRQWGYVVVRLHNHPRGPWNRKLDVSSMCAPPNLAFCYLPSTVLKHSITPTHVHRLSLSKYFLISYIISTE
ncbi:hypothetical protein BDR03DRAFT_587067 [Suillus americanus]|nr:hypothetical protein BDR03DRAFT_587067 [Suillus americanus]